MLYETAIRLDDGQIHKLLYDTETEWLWFAANGRPYSLGDHPSSKKAVKIKVPDRIYQFAQRT